MKKIFTLLFTVVTLLSAFTVKADEITITLDVYDSTSKTNVKGAEDCKTNLIRYEDNLYVIENFLNSGQSVQFTIGEFSNDVAKISVQNVLNYNGSTTYPFFYEGKKFMNCFLTDMEGNEVEIEQAYFYNKTKDYPTVKKLSDADAQKTGFTYHFDMTVEGYVGDDYSDTYYVGFYFNEPEATALPSAPEVVFVQDITLSIENASNTTVYKTCPTTLTYYSNGVYTIGDFMNTGAPVSFTFDAPGAGYSVLPTLVDNVSEDYTGYFSIMSEDGSEYMDAKAVAENGDETTIYYAYIYNYTDYCYVYDQSSDAGATKQYESLLTVSGYSNTSTWADADWYSVTFYFDGPKQSGIADVIASDDEAPVEYYNLNGVRVQNPSAGLYIRKQGGDVKKVVIR